MLYNWFGVTDEYTAITFTIKANTTGTVQIWLTGKPHQKITVTPTAQKFVFDFATLGFTSGKWQGFEFQAENNLKLEINQVGLL